MTLRVKEILATGNLKVGSSWRSKEIQAKLDFT